jgi:universal stress protein E
MQLDRLFVVYDPTTDAQHALERAAVIAGIEGAKVHLYACIHGDTAPDGLQDEEQAINAQVKLLEKAAQPLREQGIEVSTEVEWEKDWYQAMLNAVDIGSGDQNRGQLNESVLNFCQRFTAPNPADVFFVNAYKDLPTRPDRGTLVRSCGVDKDRIFIELGDPDKVIVDKANELGANLVVIGNSARSGLAALMKGNTAEKVLDQLDCDLLALT